MKALDLTNQRFGQLVATKRGEKIDRYTRWVCLCDCGRETTVRTDYLRNGHTTSCGCACGRVDITGQTFGRLTVIESIPGGKQRCLCSCGNMIEVLTYNLKNGNTQSCGCLQKEKTSEANFISLVGQRFGKLIVQERVENNRYGHVCYKCKCDCGGETIVDVNNLRNGNTNSCGCLKSKGEMIINNWLQNHDIIFQAQYSHEQIVLDSNRRPFFDFAIFDNNDNLLGFIEYNGKQHYEITGGWNTEEQFQITQDRDNQKREWCKKLNIPLYEIKYNENIEQQLERIIKEVSE